MLRGQHNLIISGCATPLGFLLKEIKYSVDGMDNEYVHWARCENITLAKNQDDSQNP